MTAYMLWLQDTRSKIKADNPGISITEISKKAGILWKSLAAIDKKVKVCLTVTIPVEYVMFL